MEIHRRERGPFRIYVIENIRFKIFIKNHFVVIVFPKLFDILFLIWIAQCLKLILSLLHYSS